MNNALVDELDYKRTLLSIFVNIKTDYLNGRAGKREEFLARLSERFDLLPKNTKEDNIELFTVMYDEMMEELKDYYSITYEEKYENDNYNRVYKLTENESLKDIIKDYTEHSLSSRFMDGFLQNRSHSLYNIARRAKQSVEQMSGMGATKNNDGEIVLSPFYIPNKASIYTAICRKTYSVGNFFKQVEQHIEVLEQLRTSHTEFMQKVNEYKEESKEMMIREHIRFGTTYLKEIMSRIIIPVSCLEDEELKRVCEEQEREVFVRKPEMEDFLFPGAHVHIYSSHDLENDSGYIIKPVQVEASVPTDTEDLIYHGIGLYSNYDAASERSNEGASPHVIGGVLYCGADLDEFTNIIPEELLEEIKICEKLVESMNGDVEFDYTEETSISTLIRSLKESNSIDVSVIVKQFMELKALGDASPLTPHQKRLLLNSEFKRMHYTFNHEYITEIENQPYGYCLLKDNSGNFSAVKRTAEGNVVHQAILSREYGESAFLAACKALDLPTGFYPIYDFMKRMQPKERALMGMAHYMKSE